MTTVKVVAWDTETALIRPACCAPPLACITWHIPGELKAHIADRTQAEAILRGWLEDPDVRLVGHNIAFDFAVVCQNFPALQDLVFAAYDADRVTDTMIRQWLLDNANGCYRGRPGEKGVWQTFNYALEDLARRCNMRLQKDAWRLSYGEFLNVPLVNWATHAVTVQAAARARLPEREALLASLNTTPKAKRAKGANKQVTALTKEIEGLREMIASEPEQCLKYPLEDATATMTVYMAQERHAGGYLADQFRQARAYFALNLQSAWGLRTDEVGVEILRRETQAERDDLEQALLEAGLIREDGSRDTKAAKARMLAVCKAAGIPVIRTAAHVTPDKAGNCCPSACTCGNPDCNAVGRKAGHTEDFDHPDFCLEHVCLDGDACEAVAEHDDVFGDYAEYTTLGKVLGNDIEALLGGVRYPVHTRWGFAATGRVTSAKPNITNQSKRAGIREAFFARPGMVFIECDYPSVELYTLAQCCVTWFGKSRLAEALLDGLDPHTAMAANILKMPYAEAKRALDDNTHPRHGDIKKKRQQSKPANFGFPGGMGVEKFLATARKQMGREEFAKLDLDMAAGRQLKQQWIEAWPEMAAYFARVNQLCDTDSGKATVETLFTKRTRGGATYCATSNNGFQALASDCAKEALWRVAKACYVDKADPMYGSRAVAFVHDEIIAEAPAPVGPSDWRAHNAAYGLARHMREGANIYLPDVPIPEAKMKPVMMYRWYKAAETLHDGAGRLVACKPVLKPGTTDKYDYLVDDGLAA